MLLRSDGGSVSTARCILQNGPANRVITQPHFLVGRRTLSVLIPAEVGDATATLSKPDFPLALRTWGCFGADKQVLIPSLLDKIDH